MAEEYRKDIYEKLLGKMRRDITRIDHIAKLSRNRGDSSDSQHSSSGIKAFIDEYAS